MVLLFLFYSASSMPSTCTGEENGANDRDPPFEAEASPPTLRVPASGPFTNESVPGRPITLGFTLLEYTNKQLSVRKLDSIHLHLWWAGRPGNIRPLHSQKLMKRDIVITENIDLHLIWFDTTYYVKPLPEWLLSWNFYKQELCKEKDLFQAANGFLRTYTKLVRYPCDFRIARDMGLLPGSLEKWEDWSRMVASIRRDGLDIADQDMSKRYRYGELRLRRLNVICHVFQRQHYHSIYVQYDQFFSSNFAWLLLFVVYLSVILSAMQVILSTDKKDARFEDASYWLSLAALLFVVATIGLQVFLFVVLFLYNLACTIINLEKEGVPWAGHTRGES